MHAIRTYDKVISLVGDYADHRVALQTLEWSTGANKNGTMTDVPCDTYLKKVFKISRSESLHF